MSNHKHLLLLVVLLTLIASAGCTPNPAPLGPTSAPTIVLPTSAPTAAAALPSGWWDGAVCYEIFVRSFYDSDGNGIGDFNGLIEKLDYINDGDPQSEQDLGANCIWLMPVFAATSYHGYDVTDYYTVEPDYGTNEDFRRFVAAAHQRGIKVVLDLVLNHTSDKHPWFQSAITDTHSPYRDWYIWSETKPAYKGPFNNEAWFPVPGGTGFYYGLFSSGMPDLNYRNPAVTAEAQKITRFWLDEMGVDGYRLDAIKHLIEHGAAQSDTAETHAWLRDFRAFLDSRTNHVFTIGEIFDGNPFSLKDYYPDQLDSYFEFDVAKQIRGAANLSLASGYVKAVQAAYTKLPFQRWAPFLTNHDQNRAMAEFGGDMGKAKVAATALLTLPGMPFVYYGEEIGMTGVKPDERLRTPMQWSAAATVGFTRGTPWEAPQANAATVNVITQANDPASLLNHYRRLIHLHVSHPALATGSFTPLNTSNSSVAAFLRQTENETLLVVINFDPSASNDLTLTLDASTLAPGTYQLTTLLGNDQGSPLTVGENGSISAYRPLGTLAARTGYVFRAERGKR